MDEISLIAENVDEISLIVENVDEISLIAENVDEISLIAENVDKLDVDIILSRNRMIYFKSNYFYSWFISRLI